MNHMRAVLRRRRRAAASTGLGLFAAPTAEFVDDGDGTHSWIFAFPPEITAGMHIFVEYSANNFSSILETASYTLTAPDLVGGTFSFTIADLANGTYKARFYTKSAAFVVNSLVSVEYPFTVINLITDTFISTSLGTVSGLNFNFADVVTGFAADSRLYLLLLFAANANTHKHNAVVANGGALVFTGLGGMGAAADTANANYVSAWIAPIPAGGTITAPQLQSDVAPGRVLMAAYVIGRAPTLSGTPIKAFSASAAGATTVGGTMDIAAGGFAAAIAATTTAANSATFVGVTETHDALNSGTHFVAGGMYINTGAAEIARAINVDYLVDPSVNIRFIAVGFGAKELI